MLGRRSSSPADARRAPIIHSYPFGTVCCEPHCRTISSLMANGIPPMYTLYYAPGSAAVLVHLTLLECSVPYSLCKVDLETGQQRSADYLALNPDGVVPTLVIDGQAYSESAALAMLLTERHPEAALAPAPGSAPRASYLQWMFYLANSLQPAFRQWFYAGEHVPNGAEVIRPGIYRPAIRVEAQCTVGITDGRTTLERDHFSIQQRHGRSAVEVDARLFTEVPDVRFLCI